MLHLPQPRLHEIEFGLGNSCAQGVASQIKCPGSACGTDTKINTADMFFWKRYGLFSNCKILCIQWGVGSGDIKLKLPWRCHIRAVVGRLLGRKQPVIVVLE